MILIKQANEFCMTYSISGLYRKLFGPYTVYKWYNFLQGIKTVMMPEDTK
ncbi:MAG TPA: hypothetical protein VN451_02515 [Chitinophagaceae bacterium]|nr:hypothetical protein [Chitinophagaceae bacterium]